MYIGRLELHAPDEFPRDELADLAFSLLCCMRMNGQVCDKSWPTYADDSKCTAFFRMPEKASYQPRFRNDYVANKVKAIKAKKIAATFQTLGPDAWAEKSCTCKDRQAYILYTDWVSDSPPIRCLQCFLPLALYRLPTPAAGEFYRLICWQSDYQSCDSLQMNDTTLVQSATRQIAELDTNLYRQGRQVCNELAARSGCPFYYYLYRASGKNAATELRRKCPSCGGPWRVETPLHDIFDFKCDRCHLLSNIAWNVRRRP
jgi:predicted  nucleic acid-binding Zn ribbon protein